MTLGERASSACIGALFGAGIGAALVWLFGVFSQRMGPGRYIGDPLAWILWPAGVLAVCGFLMGSQVGSLIGSILSGLLAFESADRDPELPTWLALVLALALAAALVWWLR